MGRETVVNESQPPCSTCDHFERKMATSTASRQAQRASTAAATGRSRVAVPAVLAQASAHGVSQRAGSATQVACDAASSVHCAALVVQVSAGIARSAVPAAAQGAAQRGARLAPKVRRLEINMAPRRLAAAGCLAGCRCDAMRGRKRCR